MMSKMLNRNVARLLTPKLAAIAAVTGLCLLFQNCIGTPDNETPASTTSSSVSGNGTGYGGVTIVDLLPTGTPCPDLTTINRRVQIVSSVATIVRDNCQDLSSPQLLGPVANLSQDQTTISGIPYQLESLLSDGKGVSTKNLAGDYAPAMASDVLPLATYVEGVPLGSNYILVAFSQQTVQMNSSSGGNEVIFRLYYRSGVNLTLKQELPVLTQTAFNFSDYRVLLGSFAFDDTHAVVVVHNLSPYTSLSLLITRNGDSISLADSSYALGNIIYLSGHPIDSTHYLASYIPSVTGPLLNIGMQVISLANEKLVFGSPLLLPNPAPQTANGPVSLLAGSGGHFDAYQANTNVTNPTPTTFAPNGTGNLLHFSVQVNGLNVSGGTDIALAGSAIDLLEGFLDMVGNAAASIFTFENPLSRYSLGRLTQGIYSTSTPLPSNNGSYTGTMNMLGSENLNYGGRYYYRLPADTGTRIYYLDSQLSDPKIYNTAFMRTRDYNSSRLFTSGDHLVLLEADSAFLELPVDGHIRVLSTPP